METAPNTVPAFVGAGVAHLGVAAFDIALSAVGVSRPPPRGRARFSLVPIVASDVRRQPAPGLGIRLGSL